MQERLHTTAVRLISEICCWGDSSLILVSALVCPPVPFSIGAVFEFFALPDAPLPKMFRTFYPALHLFAALTVFLAEKRVGAALGVLCAHEFSHNILSRK